MYNREHLSEFIPPELIKDKYIDKISFAADAGFYQLIPQAVVHAQNAEQIASLFHYAHQQNVPVVFRGGGTSLSGQAITDGILVDLSRFWTNIQIENDGLQVRLAPGVIGGKANAFLKKHHRKIGPDPSSIAAAMIGGIVSNNASGMCCGVAQNSYHSTQFIKFMLVNGQSYSTEIPEDYKRFETENIDLSKRNLQFKTKN